jgi:lipoprotein Spr
LKFIINLFLILVFQVFFVLGQTASAQNQFAGKPYHNFFISHHIDIDSCIDQKLYQLSYDWMGTRYKYSGSSNKGIDCSGLTKIIYKEVFHDTLSGGSSDFVHHVSLIKKEDLLVGDMVFFKIKKNRVSHVGVYLGNNKFVHAAIKGGVQINDLDEAYYKRYFYMGGRRRDFISIK